MSNVCLNILLLVPQLCMLIVLILTVKAMERTSKESNEYFVEALKTQLKIEELRSKQMTEWIEYIESAYKQSHS